MTVNRPEQMLFCGYAQIDKRGLNMRKRDAWNNFAPLNSDKYESALQFDYAGNLNCDQTLYLSVPKDKKNVPLLIFFHGGGMTADPREIPDKVYDGEFAVVEPRYRLADSAAAPAQIEDAAQAIAWCFAHAEEYSIDRTKIFVGGMSAGAYLAAIAVMNPVFLEKYKLHYRDIAGLALISGQMTTHFRIKSDLKRDNGQYNPLIDEYAPLSCLSADLPPILLVTGESGLDIPVRPEENAFAAASLKAMGHPFIRYYSLAGHTHTGSMDSCDFLLMKFLYDVLSNKDSLAG